jgi:uncharacterized protein YndB with AHSA1/START domain
MAEIRIRRTLPASPERVWRALTEPTALCAWFWPESSFGTTATVDLREGGSYRIDAVTAGISAAGRYVSVEPPKRLVMTWQWAGEGEQTLITIELLPDGDGTELSLVHERFTDGAARDGHAQGWSDCLDRLPGWLTSTGNAFADGGHLLGVQVVEGAADGWTGRVAGTVDRDRSGRVH